MKAGELPNLEMANRAGDSLEDGNDEPFGAISPGPVIDVVLVKHRWKGEQDAQGVGPKPLFKVVLGLKRRVVIQFRQNPFDSEILDMDKRLIDGEGLIRTLYAFMHLSDKSQALLGKKPNVVGGVPDTVMNGFF